MAGKHKTKKCQVDLVDVLKGLNFAKVVQNYYNFCHGHKLLLFILLTNRGIVIDFETRNRMLNFYATFTSNKKHQRVLQILENSIKAVFYLIQDI